MSFLYPWFLLALSAISIPIIIHLFHFRRFRKVYFPNISFLEALTEETEKQARIKHLLVLLSRILAIIFLVLAFARPYIKADEDMAGAGYQYVSVFIDNSFSMEAESAYGTLLGHAMETAREVTGVFSPTDRFQLLTNDFEGRHQRFVSRDEFLQMLQEVDFSPTVRSLSQVADRQADMLNDIALEERARAFVLSDFQKIIADLEEITPDTSLQRFWIPFQARRPANLFIDSVWIENPVRMQGQSISIMVRVYNDSPDAMENQPVRLYMNENQRAVASYNVPPNSHTDVALNFTLGSSPLQQGWVEISDYPVIFDDRFYFSFMLTDEIPVLAINRENPNVFLNALLARDTTFLYHNVDASAIDYSAFPSQNLIILNELNSIGEGLSMELRRYVEEGGNLLIFPSVRADLASYNNFLSAMDVNGFTGMDTASTRVTALNELHPVYTGVFDRIPENIDLPRVDQHYVISRRTAARDSYLMQLQNGNPFFTSTSVGRGQVFLSSVPANDSFSNFPRHAMFVPTVYNIALHSASFQPLYYTLGQDEFISTANRPGEASGQLFRIATEGLEIVPEMRTLGNTSRLYVHDQIREAGNYRLLWGEELLQYVAFNYDRRESLLDSYSTDEIRGWTGNRTHDHVFEAGSISIDQQMERYAGGQQLWKIFLIMALAFLLLEVLLLRFMK